MSPLMDKLIGLFSPTEQSIGGVSDKDWEGIVLVAREAGVLGRLYHIVKQQDLLSVLPEYPYKHMEAASLYSARQAEQVRYESKLLVDTLGEPYQMAHMFLKGAAYVVSDNPVHLGRMFSDIDLLVTKQQINEVEQKLMLYGWFQDEKSDYDQRYYRQWIHEIPPLSHAVRGTVLDLHHNIVPPVSGRAPQIALLWDTLVTQKNGTSVMSPAGMSLHSLVHLFFQEEFSHGFRDLSDLNILFSEHGKDPAYWDELVSLAEQTGFGLELYLAVRFTRKVFSTPIPDEVLVKVRMFKPGALKMAILNWAFNEVLMPHHSLVKSKIFTLANTLLFVRGHLLKMPIHILVYHTVSKSIHWLNFLLTGRNVKHAQENNRSKQ